MTMKKLVLIIHSILKQNIHIGVLYLLFSGCSTPEQRFEMEGEEGSFLVYRRQSMIGQENYKVSVDDEEIVVQSLQGENERGRITGIQAELHLNSDFSPSYYLSQRIANDDTTNIFKMDVGAYKVTVSEKYFQPVSFQKPIDFFPLHSNIPAAMEMMLYRYYFLKDTSKAIPTLPRGEVTITHRAKDQVTIGGAEIMLDRYVVEGINWGGRTVWLDKDKKLIALVKANTQIREVIRKGYEEAIQTFIDGNVEEQMHQLAGYTEDTKGPQSPRVVLMGADVVDGVHDQTKKEKALVIEKGKIVAIEDAEGFEVPVGAKVIDLSGKTLMPGLWDMHAHSNQVQWGPAYLAGGITTIRDNGNEIEFATAFRDAIAKKGMTGPDILLAGMTDGAGEKGNGAIRARNTKEAKEVVEMYHSKGYKQIKIYTSIQAAELKVLVEEAHKRGMTVTGHVPAAVGNAIEAVEMGMDMLSHSTLFLSALFPDKSTTQLGRNFLNTTAVTKEQVGKTAKFFLDNATVLDPTINLNLIRYIPKGAALETVEPDAYRIAYELWESKRFRPGVKAETYERSVAGYRRIMKIIGDLYKAGVPIVAGTDNAVPVFSLYQEMETYQNLGGLSPYEALKTATIIPATAMGMGDQTGSIEVGKEADIAILDRNPLDDIKNIRTVSAVITNGNYYDCYSLWEAADFLPTRQQQKTNE